MKRYYLKPPLYVAQSEAYCLYRFMVTGESLLKDFLDKRNQIIFDTMDHLQKQNGMVGSRELCRYLASQNQLESAGGPNYLQKVFASFEPPEVY